jgi:V8-like Glu-specific endopeptidase/endonuclease/exonuclease/phosphatase family metal-dependent hydrolase/lysophospholipase L1-like esterase
MSPKIELDELRSMMRDCKVDKRKLADYFIEDKVNSKAFSPSLVINPETVDTKGLEGEIAMRFLNSMSKMRRHYLYGRKIKKNPNLIRIVSEGDSWFQYPLLLDDVIDNLFEDYAVFSLGAAGDLLADMIAVDEITSAIQAERPRLFLISGGGNDMVGDERLVTMLHPFAEGRLPVEYPNDNFSRFLTDMEKQYRRLFNEVLNLSPDLKILCHGYDRAVPNNGPWLGKPMKKKLNIRTKKLQRDIIAIMINQFNETLAKLAAEFHGSVVYVDCRGVVADKNWHDELHPDNIGYRAVAEKFKSFIEEVINRRRESFAVSKPLSPGYDKRVKDAVKVPESDYRKLVARRARKLLGVDVGLIDEDKRRELETDISQYYEKVHMGADFLPAKYLSDGAERAAAVCRLNTQESLGTGFLVASKNFIMTNNHVLPDIGTAETSVAEFGYEKDGKLIRVTLRPRRFFITDKDLDYTIVACDGSSLGEIEAIALLRNPMTVVRGDRVNIIQHPQGRQKEIAIHDNKVLYVKDKVIQYRTDTQPGSSGSAVFNNDWDLVALHHAGWSDVGGAATNEGIRMAAIVAHLISRSRREIEVSQDLKKLLLNVADTSPLLGFFDVEGVTATDDQEVKIPTFAGTGDFGDIGFWNLENFNRSVGDGHIERIAEVLNHLSQDIIGLVGIEEPALKRLLLKMKALGNSMGYQVVDAPGSRDQSILFDQETSAVEPAEGLLKRYNALLEYKTPSGRSAFLRRPLFARCRIIENNANPVEFIMIMMHLKEFGDPQSRAARDLAAKILAKIINEIRERENLPVFLAGDFNQQFNNDVIKTLTETPDLFAFTAADAVSGAAAYIGGLRKSLIDHIVISKDLNLGQISSDEAAVVRLERSVRSISSPVSDHIPIVMRTVFRKVPLDIADMAPMSDFDQIETIEEEKLELASI